MLIGHPLSTSLGYAAGVSERIRRVFKGFNIRVVFRSGPTLRSLLTKVKDPLHMEKQATVVYEVPCICGKVYIGEIRRRLETCLKEHKDACIMDRYRKLRGGIHVGHTHPTPTG